MGNFETFHFFIIFEKQNFEMKNLFEQPNRKNWFISRLYAKSIGL